MTGPIDRYLLALGAQLDLSATQRAATLEEVRMHLEETVAKLCATGHDGLEAE